MKKIIFTLSLALVLAACGSTPSKSQKSESKTQTEATAQTKAAAQRYTLDQALESCTELVDKEIAIVGTITHTCKHSGRRCFIVGDNQEVTFRVEAKGDIGGFNRELIGSEVAITGTFKENRLTEEYLDQWEEAVREAQGKEDGSTESCGAETNNINKMREWMKQNNKDYYSIYYMDGNSYEVLD